MKVIVFGGTGPTGKAVLQKSVQDPGLKVTAFVRTPSKIPPHVRGKLEVIIGDALNDDNVADAVLGHDAVISCLGNGRNFGKTSIVSQGIMNIVNGMRKHGVKKLTFVSVAFLLPGIKVPFFLKNPAADHEMAYDFLRSVKDIDWVAIAAPGLIRALSGGSFQVAINRLPGGRLVATKDVAAFLISTIKSDQEMQEYTRQLVGISSTITLTEWLTKTLRGRILVITLSATVIGFLYRVYA